MTNATRRALRTSLVHALPSSRGVSLSLVLAAALASAFLPSSVAWAVPLGPCGSPPCTIGANLEVVSANSSGGGGGGGGATLVFINDAVNPGFTITGNTPITDNSGESGSSSVTFSLLALNGRLIEDVSASVGGSFTGTGTGSVTFTTPGGDLVLGHLTTGGSTTLSGDVTFSPVSSLDELVTLSGSGGTDGSVTINSFTYQVSLVAPAAVPEPSTLLLFGSGLAGLAGAARRLLPRP